MSLGGAIRLVLLVAVSVAGACVPARAQEDFRLVEFTPWLVKNSGPEKAKGVIYFLRGWGQFNCCRNRDDFQMVPYFVLSLAASGWDVAAAKIPEGPRRERAHDAVPSGVAYVKRRVGELRREGYKRVVVGGHSWGAWVALEAAQDRSFGADALLLNSPSTYGPETIPGGRLAGKRNPDHMNNWTNFKPLMDQLTVPTVLMLFSDDPFEPNAPRAEYAKQQFTKRKVPHLIVDRPKGFTGHSGAWLPVFDYLYGNCIETFVEKPETQPCPPKKLAKDDFRSVISVMQLPKDENSLIAFPDVLVGRKFAAYTLADSMRHYDYVSKTERLNMYSLDETREGVEFRDGLHCVKDKCSILVWWSERAILEFDAKSGKLNAWWLER